MPKYVGKKVRSYILSSQRLGQQYHLPGRHQDYGRSPPYLERRKKEMAEAQAEYDRYVEESMRQGQMEQVSEQER